MMAFVSDNCSDCNAQLIGGGFQMYRCGLTRRNEGIDVLIGAQHVRYVRVAFLHVQIFNMCNSACIVVVLPSLSLPQ